MPPLINTAIPNPNPVAVPQPVQATGAPMTPQQGIPLPAPTETAPPPADASGFNIPNFIQSARQQQVPDEQIYKYLQDKGMVPSPVQQPGLFQSIVQGVASPFLKIGTSLLNAGAATRDLIDSGGHPSTQATMDLNTPRDFGYFGKVSPFSTEPGAGFRQAAGAGVEAGSWFLGLGEADALKSATGFLSKALVGARSGAVIGATQGLGSGLQNPDASIGSVAGSTAEGGVAGAVIGGLLTGAFSKVVDIFTGKSAPVSPTPDFPAEGGPPTNPEGTIAKFVRGQVQQEWKDALNLPASVTKQEAKSGKDIVSLLTKAGIKPDAINDGRLVLDEAIQTAKTNALVADKALTTFLDTEPAYVSAGNILTDATKELRSTGLSLDSAKEYLQNQLSSFIKQSGKAIQGAEDGGAQMRLVDWNDIKGKAWTNVVDFGDPAKSIKNDANNAIAKAIKKSIEDNVEDINIKALNSHIGDWWHAVEVLQARNGAKVAGRGLTKVAAKAAGSVAGTILTHGLGGTLGGQILGGQVADFMTNSLLPMEIKMGILRRLESDPETAPLVKQAWEIINKRMSEAAGRLQLPAPGSVMDAGNVSEGLQGSKPQFNSNGESVIMAGPPKGPNPEPYKPNFKYRPPRPSMDLTKIRIPKSK